MSKQLAHNYGQLLQELKEKIRSSRVRAVVAVNTELLKLYWEIGEAINAEQATQSWGAKVIDRLIADLKMEFEDMKGLSVRNLKYMRAFANAYPSFLIVQQRVAQFESVENQDDIIVQRAVAQLPWGHNCTLLDKVKTTEKRAFYAQKAAENAWTRDILVHQIDSKLYESQQHVVNVTNNFSLTLPGYDGELADQLFKDPYNLDFIRLSERAKEKDLEDALMDNVIKFLLALGDGFALLGRQRRFEVGGKEFIVDLLFYHTGLRRHIVVELKIGEFKAEYVSKMNLYLGIVDDQLQKEFDAPAIGLILCKTKNKIVAEYALRDTHKPIGIAEYKIGERLPADIKSELPSIEEIETKMDEELKEPVNPIDERLRTIKEKLKNLHKEEIQSPVDTVALNNLYIKVLLPLYREAVTRLNVFAEDFHEAGFHWQANKPLSTYEELEGFWNESAGKIPLSFYDLSFSYVLKGLKKGGTEGMNDSVTLVLMLDTYWYGFRIVNHNQQQPFIKKLYHQLITKDEMTSIVDRMVSMIMDGIERFLNTQ